jgi:thioredoxin-related protein
MKKITLSFLVSFLICSSDFAQMAPLPADAILKSSCAKASSENKNILLIFHASWCGWCKKMDASLNDSLCKPFFDKYYVIEHLTVLESKDKVELENPGGMDYLKKFKGEDHGLPYWVILDKKGELLFDSRMDIPNSKSQNAGCPASEKEVLFFVNILKSSSALKQDQLDIIARRFRKNETN